jgi:hypothetical protein
MPQANTLSIGSVPPVEGWDAKKRAANPQIIDTDPAHPLMQWVNLGDVALADGTPLVVPQAGRVLIDSHIGPMFAIAPRQRFEDAALGFVFIDQEVKDGQTQQYIGTNWPIRPSFPLFVLNMLEYLGGGRTVLEAAMIQPGQPITLDNPAPDKPLEVLTPKGERIKLKGEKGERINFTATDDLGVYQVRLEGKTIQQFAVNLFDVAESDIRPREKLDIGPVEVAAQASGWTPARRESWKWILLAGFGVLVIEWYIYNRRVSL